MYLLRARLWLRVLFQKTNRCKESLLKKLPFQKKIANCNDAWITGGWDEAESSFTLGMRQRRTLDVVATKVHFDPVLYLSHGMRLWHVDRKNLNILLFCQFPQSLFWHCYCTSEPLSTPVRKKKKKFGEAQLSRWRGLPQRCSWIAWKHWFNTCFPH